MHLNDLGIVCAIGSTRSEIYRRMLDGTSGVTMYDSYFPGRDLPVGRAEAELPSENALPIGARSRNNRLAVAALEQIRQQVDDVIDRYGPERIGIVIGTSTSGIAEGEKALCQYIRTGTLPERFHYSQIELNSPAKLLASLLRTTGPAYVHSNACASSAK